MMKAGRSGMTNPTFVLEKQKLQKHLSHFEYLARETGIIWFYTIKTFEKQEGLSIIAHSFSGFSIGNNNEYNKVQKFDKMLHSYSPVYYPDEVENLAKQSTTMSFNSLNQWQDYAELCSPYSSLGLRINPHLNLDQPSYCDSNISRFGVGYKDFLEHYSELSLLDGLHFHALCHQGLDALEKLFIHIETNYKAILPKLKWLNLGGGQNFTHDSYNTQGFITLIQKFKVKYPHLTLYFEPGSAVLYECGYFECTVMDIIDAKTPVVILNTSIESHLLDVAITKQQPKIRATIETKTDYTYILTGMSCIAGDVIGRYYFNQKLHIGDKIIFEDMMGYTMVKQTSFNGLKEALFQVV